MLLVDKIKRKPSESEIQRVCSTKRACGSGPEGTLSQDINHTSGAGGTRWRFRARHPFYPTGQPHQAKQSDPQEDWTPAKMCHQQSSAKRSRCGSEFHSSNDGAICEPASMLGQVPRQDRDRHSPGSVRYPDTCDRRAASHPFPKNCSSSGRLPIWGQPSSPASTTSPA